MKDINQFFKYDMHVHTSEVSPCAKIPAAEVVDLYLAKGFKGIFITDHFKGEFMDSDYMTWEEKMDYFLQGYKKAKRVGDQKGLDVFLGVELRLPGKVVREVLAIGVTEQLLKKYENLHEYEADELYQLAKKEDLLLFQAHPFRNKNEVVDYHFVDGYEALNGHQPQEINDLAYELCRKHDLLEIAGSDFHNINGVNKCGIYTHEPIGSEKDLVKKMKQRAYGLFYGLPLSEDNIFYKNPDFIKIVQ